MKDIPKKPQCDAFRAPTFSLGALINKQSEEHTYHMSQLFLTDVSVALDFVGVRRDIYILLGDQYVVYLVLPPRSPFRGVLR